MKGELAKTTIPLCVVLYMPAAQNRNVVLDGTAGLLADVAEANAQSSDSLAGRRCECGSVLRLQKVMKRCMPFLYLACVEGARALSIA
jgi:hypothetical protein